MYAILNRKKRRLVGWVFAVTLIAALLITGTAFAEGEEPPPAEPAPAEEAPAAEEPAAPAPEEPALAEETEAEEAAEPEEIEEAAPEEQAPPEEPADAPAVEEPAAEETAEDDDTGAAAAQTGVELADGEGETLDMASQETAELLTSGDPYYTVGSIKYSFYASGGMCGGDPHCIDGLGAGVIQYALDYMDITGLPSNRMLYVEQGAYNAFAVDGTASPKMAMLNGVIGKDGADWTTINGGIYLGFNTGGFTLSGFSVDGDIYAENNNGTLKLTDLQAYNTGNGILVWNHAGKVELDQVDASDNQYNGAWINNTMGSYPVTVTNSSFSDNGFAWDGTEAGLHIFTNNKVTIDGVAATGNKGDGIRIDQASSASIKNVFLFGNDSQAPADDYGYGMKLNILGKGSTVLEYAYAGGNEEAGILINGGSLRAKELDMNGNWTNAGLAFLSTTGSARVERGRFSNNGASGLYIENHHSIYVSNVAADNNGWYGLFLDNSAGSGTVTVTSPKSGGYFLGNSFNNNGLAGVEIHSQGSVSLYNFEARNNGDSGVVIINDYGKGAVTVSKNIKQWNNEITDNGWNGMFIISNGNVTINDTRVERSSLDGVWVDTMRTITLRRVWSMENTGGGAQLYNDNAANAYGITLYDCAFNFNGGPGLIAESKGAIKANGLGASGNSLRHLYLGSSNGYSVSIVDLLYEPSAWDIYEFYGTVGEGTIALDAESDDFDTVIEVYDSTWTWVAGNDDWGGGTNSHLDFAPPADGTYYVEVHSYLYDDNGGTYTFALNDGGHASYWDPQIDGAWLDNTDGSGGVSISHGTKAFKDEFWGNLFDSNAGHGLTVDSFGTISINGAAACDNIDKGLDLTNPASRASVTVKNTRTDDFWSGFNENGSHGMEIETLGNITLQHVGAWWNGEYGAILDNCQWVGGVCTGFGSVNIKASSNRRNTFNENALFGLQVYSKGSIKAANVEASDNGMMGAYLGNDYYGATGPVTLSTAGKNGWNWFNNNGWTGLGIDSFGTISIKNVDAYGNGTGLPSSGAWLDNSQGPNVRSINITKGYFGENTAFGLHALSKGSITWRYGSAHNNGEQGAHLDNAVPGGTGNISYTASNRDRGFFNDNGWNVGPGDGDGFWAESTGTISFNYADAWSNNGHGVELNNENTFAPKTVTVKDLNAGNNYSGSGLWVRSLGNITVTGIDSQENAEHGADLLNVTGPGNVTVSSSGFFKGSILQRNGWNGLNIFTAGKVTLTNTAGPENGIDGIWVDNTLSLSASPVIFKTTNDSYWNGENGNRGVVIDSWGPVTFTNTYTFWSCRNQGGDGVFIDNSWALTPQKVTIKNVAAHENNGSGFEILTNGAITATSLEANDNNGHGAFLNSAVSGNITISGNNQFVHNGWGGGGDGLEVQGHGNVTISNVYAEDNAWNGMFVTADTGKITLKNSMVRGNGMIGAGLDTAGDFYLYKVYAFSNGWNDPTWNDGLYLSGGWFSKVTIKYSYIQANWGDGIEIAHPDAPPPGVWPAWLSLSKTKYFGNGGMNINIHVP